MSESQLQPKLVHSIPLYYPLKFTFLLFLIVREYSGPVKIYNFIRLLLQKKVDNNNVAGKKKKKEVDIRSE